MSLIPPSPIISGSMAINVAGFPSAIAPYPNVQPFTYKDNLTFEKLFESFRSWILNDLVPHVDDSNESIVSAYNAASAALATAMQDYVTEITNDRATFNQQTADTLNQMAVAIGANAQNMTDKITAAQAAVTAAQAARDLAQQWAANTQALQDSAVKSLLADTNSQTRGQIAGIFSDLITPAIAGKYVKPATGIPKSDLASAVATSLNNADSASQPGHKHVGADITSGVVKSIAGVAPDVNGAVPVIPVPTDIAPATSVNYYVYGDSVAAGSNATSLDAGFAQVVGRKIDAIKPQYWAVSGTIPADIIRNVLAPGTVSDTSRIGLHLIHSGINSVINLDSSLDAYEKIGFRNAVKATLRVLRGSWQKDDAAGQTYTGTWLTKTLDGARSNPVKYTSTSGDKVIISTTSSEIAIMLVGFSFVSGNGGTGGTSFTITVNGAAYTPEINTTVRQFSPNNNWGPISVRVVNPNPGSSMSVVLTRGAGTDFYYDGYVKKDDNPPVILWSQIITPTTAGLAVNGAGSNRTAANVDAYKAILSDVITSPEFAADGLTKLIDLTPGFDRNTMFTSEGVHPNNLGHKVMAQNLEKIIRALPATTGLYV